MAYIPIFTQTEIVKLIYIGGYGRSGSTLLERILASHPNIVGCGELHNIEDDFIQNEMCGCGQRASDCDFYRALFNQKDELNFSETNFIASLYGPNIHFLVDSSKTTYGTMSRPAKLSVDFEIYFIHLKRNLMEVISSQMLAKGGRLFMIPAITVIMRFLANIYALYYRFRFKKSLVVRYTDLVTNPDKVLQKVEAFLGVSFEHISLHEDSIPTTHQLSGNKIRYESPLYLNIRT